MDIWRLRCPYGQGYGRWGLSGWWSQHISGNLCKSTLGQKDESHNNLIGSQGRAVVITFFSFPDQSTKCIASKNIISFTKGDLFMCIGSEVVGDLFTGVLLRGWLLDPGSWISSSRPYHGRLVQIRADNEGVPDSGIGGAGNSIWTAE